MDERDLAWADLAGAVKIVAPPALAVVRGAHLSHTSDPSTTHRWTASGAGVAEWILTAASRAGRRGDEEYVLAGVGELAAELGWSSAQVSN